jgi:uncharacterized membrane protein YphA (DoxX/SURF4 family)
MSGERKGGMMWEWLGLAARLVLGGLYVYMGLSKALQPVVFLKLVRQYEALPQPLLLNLAAAGLPWFEIFCGLLLVAGVAVRGASLLSALMLIPFTVMVTLRALNLAEARGLSFCQVKFDCGCGAGEVYICFKVVENLLLLGISLWLLSGAGRKGAARYSLG